MIFFFFFGEKKLFGKNYCFLFSKTFFFFENIIKKQFSCIFEIKNMFGQLKLKKKNTKIFCYQDLNSNANPLNKTDSLN